MSRKIDSHLCWICQLREADSLEHKIKASSLKRHFGKRYDKNPMIYGQGERIDSLDSYKSKLLMFPKVICHDCNVILTRPHDDAYDMFNEYIGANYDCMEQSSQICFSDIYGEDWKAGKKNLFKYIAKHIGCKVVTSELSHNVESLARFVREDSPMEDLKVFFELKEGIKIAYDAFNYGIPNINNAQTIWFYTNDGCLCFGGKMSYQWLSVVWVQGEHLLSNIDFTANKERLFIKYFKDCDSLESCGSLQDVYLKVENSGMNTLEDSREYYLDLLTQ